MGVFSSDGRTRAQRRAEAKALKTKAKMEAKFEAKQRRKAEKRIRKDERKALNKELKAETKAVAKVDGKATKAQVKLAKAEAKTIAAQAKADADAKRFSPASVRRYLTVARLVAPIVAPLVYRAAVSARGELTRVQATRAGVSPELLGQFAGHGATLSARIATARSAVTQVTEHDSSAEARAFVDAMVNRLDNLAIAVNAAESMAPAQRRTAHQSIAGELEAIDADVLARLGVAG